MLVTSYCSVAIVWPADIYAVGTCPNGESESTGEEENPHYIKSRFDVCLCPTHN
jgi:hypothetical protein